MIVVSLDLMLKRSSVASFPESVFTMVNMSVFDFGKTLKSSLAANARALKVFSEFPPQPNKQRIIRVHKA